MKENIAELKSKVETLQAEIETFTRKSKFKIHASSA